MSRTGNQVKIGDKTYPSMKDAERKLKLSRGYLLYRMRNADSKLPSGEKIELVYAEAKESKVLTVKLPMDTYNYIDDAAHKLNTTKADIVSTLIKYGKSKLNNKLKGK